MVDVGEGYEKLSLQTILREGDEVWNDGSWQPTQVAGEEVKFDWEIYRRKAEVIMSEDEIDPGEGWRMLEVGELILEGDEYLSKANGWMLTANYGCSDPKLVREGVLQYRRKIGSYMSTSETTESILDEAKRIVEKGRPEQYGEPEDCFGLIAELWSAYLGPRGCGSLDSQSVAMMMILMKVARGENQERTGLKVKRDTWVDVAGYAACGSKVFDGE